MPLVDELAKRRDALTLARDQALAKAADLDMQLARLDAVVAYFKAHPDLDLLLSSLGHDLQLLP